ncbi:MAG: ClpXP protease specificity-enhancing factor [Burkholderiaceae bacterium]|nr:MAG: ClpXP protease specificity-enhancing factor [Burkholderiaceae bacterium]
MSETSTKPYLIRALYEWCTDNGYTPYISVRVDARTQVPMEHVKDGEIVLNIGALATQGLEINNEMIAFEARFNAVARQIFVPVNSVSAIYARETGHGMMFEPTEAPAPAPEAGGLKVVDNDAEPTPDDTPPDHPPNGNRPALKRVK